MTETPYVYLVVNGIANLPDNVDGWTDSMILGCAALGRYGDKYEYFTSFITRWIRQGNRAKKVARLIDKWQKLGKVPVLVGHSNGCDLIIRALRITPTKGAIVHLISAAAEPDFEKNGLAAALNDGRVERVYIYMAGKDSALSKYAPASRVACAPLNWAIRLFNPKYGGLGFKSLGTIGPKNYPALKVDITREPNYGHSTWFTPENFPKTLQAIIGKTERLLA
jgi:pimeloyl-ACP methyl ester carboxylesterase